MENKLIDFDSYAVKATLKRLLKDKSTKKNIIWATNTYEHLGPEFNDKREITENLFKSGFILEPRIYKSDETQRERTKKKAEVFTPSWIVNQMNNFCDEEWFGRKNVFNTEKEKSWQPIKEKITFPENKAWQKYVDSKRLEITCGEAPFIASRYDASTGEMLLPTAVRMGILDRKLRIVGENTATKQEWEKWAVRAVESCYGYEYQGDNLLLARINILLTYTEYFEEKWGERAAENTLLKLANIISWNIWQMDGLTDTVPFGAHFEETHQMNFFELWETEKKREKEYIHCRIYDWRAKTSLLFTDLKEN